MDQKTKEDLAPILLAYQHGRAGMENTLEQIEKILVPTDLDLKFDLQPGTPITFTAGIGVGKPSGNPTPQTVLNSLRGIPVPSVPLVKPTSVLNWKGTFYDSDILVFDTVLPAPGTPIDPILQPGHLCYFWESGDDFRYQGIMKFVKRGQFFQGDGIQFETAAGKDHFYYIKNKSTLNLRLYTVKLY